MVPSWLICMSAGLVHRDRETDTTLARGELGMQTQLVSSHSSPNHTSHLDNWGITPPKSCKIQGDNTGQTKRIGTGQ